MGRVWNKNAGLPIEKCPVSEKQSFCGSKKKKSFQHCLLIQLSSSGVAILIPQMSNALSIEQKNM